MDGNEFNDMDAHHSFICSAIKNHPHYREFFATMAQLAIDEYDDPKELYSVAYTTGYARAMYDLMSGNLNIKVERKYNEGNDSKANHGPNDKTFNQH